jgi:hypothetical protein
MARKNPGSTPTAEKKEKPRTDMAVEPKVQLPAGMDLTQLVADQGAGGQNITAADIAIPIISILQANSPQCKRSDAKYIEGAVEGKLYNNVAEKMMPDTLTLVPCFFEKVFIEWRPNRGGFVAAHPVGTPLRDQVKLVKNAEGKEVPTLPSGNTLTETNQHYCLILNDDGSFTAVVIAMASSALRSSRAWNLLMKGLVLRDPKGNPFNPPTYYMTYKVGTKARAKDNYTWFGWDIQASGPVPNVMIYNAAKDFEKAVNSGGVRVKQEQVDANDPECAPKQGDDAPLEL